MLVERRSTAYTEMGDTHGRTLNQKSEACNEGLLAVKASTVRHAGICHDTLHTSSDHASDASCHHPLDTGDKCSIACRLLLKWIAYSLEPCMALQMVDEWQICSLPPRPVKFWTVPEAKQGHKNHNAWWFVHALLQAADGTVTVFPRQARENDLERCERMFWDRPHIRHSVEVAHLNFDAKGSHVAKQNKHL